MSTSKRTDRIKRHMLGLGPPPTYRMSRVIAKDSAHAQWPPLVAAWSKAIGRNATATVTGEDVDDDRVRLTITLDQP